MKRILFGPIDWGVEATGRGCVCKLGVPVSQWQELGFNSEHPHFYTFPPSLLPTYSGVINTSNPHPSHTPPARLGPQPFYRAIWVPFQVGRWQGFLRHPFAFLYHSKQDPDPCPLSLHPFPPKPCQLERKRKEEKKKKTIDSICSLE